MAARAPERSGTARVDLPIEGMTCGACAARIERGLGRLDGVASAAVNLAAERATVVYDPAVTGPPAFADKVAALGYAVAAEPDAADAGAEIAIIRLDTPGGLVDSTREIVKDITAAPMPVVVYVSPSGTNQAAGEATRNSGSRSAIAAIASMERWISDSSTRRRKHLNPPVRSRTVTPRMQRAYNDPPRLISWRRYGQFRMPPPSTQREPSTRSAWSRSAAASSRRAEVSSAGATSTQTPSACICGCCPPASSADTAALTP